MRCLVCIQFWHKQSNNISSPANAHIRKVLLQAKIRNRGHYRTNSTSQKTTSMLKRPYMIAREYRLDLPIKLQLIDLAICTLVPFGVGLLYIDSSGMS